jgi:hypothetical protein
MELAKALQHRELVSDFEFDKADRAFALGAVLSHTVFLCGGVRGVSDWTGGLARMLRLVWRSGGGQGCPWCIIGWCIDVAINA